MKTQKLVKEKLSPEEIELSSINAELSLYEFLKQAWPII